MQQASPAWSSYADEVLQRLCWSLSRMDIQRYSAYGRDEVRVAPEAEPTRSKSEDDPAVRREVDPVPEPAELDIGGLDTDFPPASSKGASLGNPADEELERLQPSALQISLALRLAATLGTSDALLRRLEPGAITAFGEVAPRKVKPLGELLRLAFLLTLPGRPAQCLPTISRHKRTRTCLPTTSTGWTSSPL